MNKLLAPNGKPSNLTPEQYKLVRTPAFKEWFGDWENSPETASKVVDSNGEPLVVYHGTKENWWNDYFVFNPQYEGKSTNIKRRKFGSIYFTSKKKVAQTFGNILIPVFLNFENPIVIDADYHDIMWVDNELETTNYEDDIIIKNTYDYRASNVKLDADMLSDIFLVTQLFNKIKLADGTNTTFDSNNPDIRFDDGGNVNEFIIGKTYSGKEVISMSKDIEKLPKNSLILEHRYFDKIKEGELGFFSGNVGDVDSSFGNNIIYISVGKNAKIKTISSTYDFLEKKGVIDKPNKYIIDKYGKYGIKTYRELSLKALDYLDNPNDYYYEFQKKTLQLIKESGEDVDVLEMLSEDELTPHQFIIINKNTDIRFDGGGFVMDEEKGEKFIKKLSELGCNKPLTNFQMNFFGFLDSLKDDCVSLGGFWYDSNTTNYAYSQMGKMVLFDIEDFYNEKEITAFIEKNYPTSTPLEIQPFDDDNYEFIGIGEASMGGVFRDKRDGSILKLTASPFEVVGTTKILNAQKKDIHYEDNFAEIYSIQNIGKGVFKGTWYYKYYNEREFNGNWFAIRREDITPFNEQEQKEANCVKEIIVNYYAMFDNRNYQPEIFGSYDIYEPNREYKYLLRKQNNYEEGGDINNEKQQLNKDMEYNNYAKGGKILGNVILNNENQPIGFNHQEQQKYARIGVTDKYQIQAYIDMGLTGVNFDSVSLAEKLKIEVQKLYDTYTDYLISEDSKGIDAFFLADIRQAEINQEPTSVIDQIKENQQNPQKRLEKVNQLAESQKYTLESWIYYFKDGLYSNEFIYLMFSAILKFNYNLVKKELINRTNKTTTNITSLSPSALAKLYTNSSNYLLKDYIEILAEEGQNLVNEVVTIQADGGTWFTFLGKGNANDLEIKENAEKLTAFVQNTKWCTTSYAYNQLAGTGGYEGQGGNFYVFAEKTENGLQPEIAIRMNGQEVGEISGTLDGQNISPEYSEIAKRFCRLNVPNNSAEEYIDKLNYNIKVGDAIKRLENEGMYPTIMEDYLYVVKNKDGIGKGKYRENPVNQKFFDSVTTAINRPNQYFQANEFSNSVSNLTPITKYFLGDLTLSQGNNFDLGTSSLTEILGKLDIENNSTSFGQLKKIGGDLIISSPTIQSFDSIEYIGGQIIFEGTNLGLTSFGNLTEYGGTINCLTQFTNLIDLGNLVECGDLIIGENSSLETTGNLSVAKSIQCSSSKNITFPNLVSVLENCDFGKSQTTDLPALQRVGGNFNINSSRVKIFPQLNFIGGSANFGNNFTSTTQNIERILGDLYLVNSRLKEFTNLKYIKGKIEFKSSLITSLGSLERIDGGFIVEDNIKLIDLGSLTYIGGICVIKNSVLQSLNKLEKIIQFAVFTNSSLKDLGNLESIGGSAYFDRTELKNLGKLKYIGGDTIKFGNRTDLEAEWKRIKSNEIDSINFEIENNFETGGELKNQNGVYVSISLLTRLLVLSNEKLNIDDYNQIIQGVENYSKGGQTEAQKEKISEVMREYKQGELKTSYGEKVTNSKQAIAIALSEANVPKKKEGGKIICAYGELPLNMENYWFDEDSKVELVPVNQLLKFKQFDRYKEPKWNEKDSKLTIKNLEKSFLSEGIKEPLIIEYSQDDNSVLLVEGNHRLQTALNMGCDYLPARVILRKTIFGKVSKSRSMQVDGIKANEYGYISSDLRPSDVGISGTKKIYKQGGIIEGQLHSECNDETGCGRKFEVGDGGHIIEAEREEAVLVANAFNDNNIYTIDGTFSQIASAINVLGGGKNFDTGAKVYKGNSTINIENIQPQAKDTDVADTIDSGSIIINRRTMNDPNKYSVNGTLKQIASLINNYNNNGVKITDGGTLKKL